MQAIRAIDEGRSVIVSAPTGAGKTLVAEYAIDKALREGTRLVYTSPIKALSNQKFRDFNATYPDKIGIMTGDVTMNPDAPILIMTTEVFRNTIFEDERRIADIRQCIFDEIHYIDDEERGTVWEESIIFAPESIRFVCLSATISNLREFSGWIAKVRNEPNLEVVYSEERPVPLRHYLFFPHRGMVAMKGIREGFRELRARRHSREKKHDIVDYLIENRRLPALYFSFSRKDCEHLAHRYREKNILQPEERERIMAIFDELATRYEVKGLWKLDELKKLIERGVAYHHAGMLPTFKEIVERIFTSGLIKLLFTTETFALGVNMPARSVAFDRLRKFNGVTFESVRTLDYFQMAGRAGRQGIDTVGYVYSMIDAKWDTEEAVQKTILGKVDPIFSKFNLSYSTILNLFQRMGEGRLEQAAERSFSAYQRSKKAWKKQMEMLHRKLDVLREAGYIRGEELTDKGVFASRINGYEIHCAEFFSRSFFYFLDEERLFLLFMAVIYEPRRNEGEVRMRRDIVREVRREAASVVEEFRDIEEKHKIRVPIKVPDWSLSGATLAWIEGSGFDDLKNFTDVQDGDLVRNFRMVLQLTRQVRKALSPSDDLSQRLTALARRVDRDEVDAERQLRLG